jgi:precorrin-6B methylase 2
VSNWYPVPSIDDLGEKEVYTIEIAAGGAQPNVVIWTVGAGGGIGIAIAL